MCVWGGHNKSIEKGINEFVKCEKSDNIVKRETQKLEFKERHGSAPGGDGL